MFENLTGKTKELAQVCYDQCSIDEIKEDKFTSDSEALEMYGVSALEWAMAHEAAVWQKMMEGEG